MRASLLNGGAFCRTDFLAIAKTATAGGAGDNAEVNSNFVDRLGEEGLAMSAKITIVWEGQLAQDATLSWAGNVQDASDLAGTDAADVGDAFTATVVATGDSAGSLEQGTTEIDVDLSGFKQFLRAQLTPNLSAGATDTLKWSAVIEFYGDQVQPASKAIVSIAA